MILAESCLRFEWNGSPGLEPHCPGFGPIAASAAPCDRAMFAKIVSYLIAESEIRPRQLLDRRAAHQLHVALDPGAHQRKRALDAGLAGGSEREKIEPADAHRLGAQ